MSATGSESPLHQHALVRGGNADGRRPEGARAPSGPRAARPVAARPQAERVLELARKRGRHGVHQTDFDAGRVVDGGKPIRRLAARIDELKARGHWFTTRRHRNRTVTYVLVQDADAVALTLRDAGEAEPDRLFEPPAAPPVNAALGDWDGAA
jgi:hypothetical protein